jgi:peptide chain release factor 2
MLEIESEVTADPNFWSDRRKSSAILKEKRGLEEGINSCKDILNLIGDAETAIEFSELGEATYTLEAESILKDLLSRVKLIENQKLLASETDANGAIVTINAGAGGTEACDWASMVLRMILRHADIRGWKSQVVDELDGEGAGIKNATVTIEGRYVFGNLKSESGVHRLVRISPYDSNARRHTSFCSVYVSAIIDDDIQIEVKDSDLRVDTFRAGGAGGQHVNRTDSAVRMTHMPSGVVVQSQSQRSQIQNRETCLKLLKAKLYEIEVNRRKADSQGIEDSKMDNAFGSQIRSYVLHPYKMVKDTRTLFQSSDPQDVLDGNLEDFSLEYLRQLTGGGFKGKGQSGDDDV